MASKQAEKEMAEKMKLAAAVENDFWSQDDLFPSQSQDAEPTQPPEAVQQPPEAVQQLPEAVQQLPEAVQQLSEAEQQRLSSSSSSSESEVESDFEDKSSSSSLEGDG